MSDDIEPIPFNEDELHSFGTTGQEQARLIGMAIEHKVDPKAIKIYELPAVHTRPDSKPRSVLAELRTFIVDSILESNPGATRQEAVIYTDLWIEYTEAQESIDANGMICLHPRTPIIIENPYLPQRAKTRAALAQQRGIRADWLWRPEAIDRAREWLDQAQKERDEKLTKGERERKRQMEGKGE